MFIAGKKDPVLSFGGGGWGDLMNHFVPDLRGKVYGAGHWVQMDHPEAVTDALLGFLAEFARASAHECGQSERSANTS